MSSAAVQTSPAPQLPNRQQYHHYSQQPQSTGRSNSTRQSNAHAGDNTSPISSLSSPLMSQSNNITQARAPPLTNSSTSPAPSPQLPAGSVPPRTSSHYRTTMSSSPPLDPQSHNNTSDSTPVASGRRTHQSQSNSSRSQMPHVQHEESTILERLVISDPVEDESRVQARVAESRPQHPGSTTPASATISSVDGTDSGNRQPTKPQSGRRKDVKFGEYILGQTLGEGEFGKVKMGWKRDGSAQVAIKLIRKEVLGSNPSRLPKIYREIKILEGLKHPNIVQLHEKVETERHIGIILEYASGGELFDYILQHRYLKDNAARRLFAQLISGVGYLHKKGIVHRDLKLENLLLDRNRNIIITDFGFANTFDAGDELGPDLEEYLHDKDFVKRMGLDSVDPVGHRRGDLMQTSCGSPCYAAPELVVSDSLYTGRKVDVWSCGVILYAMLAGYLPFDDDPANPEGDNINLLYKYIVSTPLMFPDYVTPHAKDLLRRILVPNPRQRADLFEIARHSWLSEYSHVVGFITSSTTTTNDIANTTVPSDRGYETPALARSASVREPTTKSHPTRQTVIVGGLSQKPGHVDSAESEKAKRDTKRRTVQVEYVAPQSPVTRSNQNQVQSLATPKEDPTEADLATNAFNQTEPLRSRASPSKAQPARPHRDQRSASENALQNPYYSTQRPSTGGSLSAATRVPSHGGSYGQPAVGIAKEQAQGRFSQPRLASYTEGDDRLPGDRRSYLPGDDNTESQGFPQTVSAVPGAKRPGGGHKRSSTLSGLSEKFGFGKRGSLFGGSRPNTSTEGDVEKPKKSNKKFPPVSMSRPIPNDNSAVTSTTNSRQSQESSRRTSFSFGRRSSRNGDLTAPFPEATSAPIEEKAAKRASRRFSLLPSFSRSSSNNVPPKDEQPKKTADNRPRMAFGRGESRTPSRSTTDSNIPVVFDSSLDKPHTVPRKPVPPPTSAPRMISDPVDDDDGADSDDQHNMPVIPPGSSGSAGYDAYDPEPPGSSQDATGGGFDNRPGTGKQGVLHKKRDNRFNDAFEQEGSGHAGSSGAARRVMAMFNFRRKKIA